MSGAALRRRGIRTALLLLVLLPGCRQAAGDQPLHAVPGGDIGRGNALITRYGCGTCHEVPGVRGARGMVGPPLQHFGRRVYIAGRLPNELDQLMLWIMHPQQVEPGNAMPEMGVSASDARDIAAYLYTLH